MRSLRKDTGVSMRRKSFAIIEGDAYPIKSVEERDGYRIVNLGPSYKFEQMYYRMVEKLREEFIPCGWADETLPISNGEK